MTHSSLLSVAGGRDGPSPLRLIRRSAVAGALLTASCNLPGLSAGPLQPQTVSGPCTVKNFFLVRFSNTAVEMATDDTPKPCTFTMINPDLEEMQQVAWVTGQASHGKAASGTTDSGRSILIAYTPTPGYLGPDKFTVTSEPSDRTVTVSVTVRPPSSASP